MLLGLFAAMAFVPVYWLVVPGRWRRELLAAGSLAALTYYDYRLGVLLLGLTLALFGLMRAVAVAPAGTRMAATSTGLVALAALFTWNKLAGGGASALPSQPGLVFLGISFLVLKAAAGLIESARGSVSALSYRDVFSWIVFLPTYPSGPMEELEHFRRQVPALERARAFGGLERILFGLVKALLLSHYLGVWVTPIIDAPEHHARPLLLLGLYAATLRFYFDFSGYSDIAIGLGALFGYDIEENFDHPLLRRNLVQLWQRWHMTLTRFLRLYLFIPVSRRLMRRGADRSAIAGGQIVSMTFCGLWHGLAWNFAVWGLLQAVGLIWVGTFARDVGRRLPAGFVGWWRKSRLAYGLSTAITFNTFALTTIFAVTDIDRAARYLRLLAGI